MATGTTLLVRIAGRVQRVGYRAWLERTARDAGLSGWVRNRADGTVEALLSGEDADVRRVLELCHEGPPAAQVTKVDAHPAAAPSSADFVVLPTE